MAMTYGTAYVAQVALGANKAQLLTALTEAEAYNGPSLIIAYSPCISHGVSMSESVDEEKKAVDCGHWHLFRFHPDKEKPLTLDSKRPTLPLSEFLQGENRFASIYKTAPKHADELWEKADEQSKRKWDILSRLSEIL